MGDVNHIRLVVSGGRKDGDINTEIWQFGLNFMPTLGGPMDDIHTVAGDFDAAYDVASSTGTGYNAERNYNLEGGVTDIDPMDWLENEVAPAIQQYLNTTNLFNPDIYCTGLDAYPIGNDGKVITLPVGAAVASLRTTVNTWDGSSATNSMAPFTSFAISTVTAANIPRGRGRFYPPPPVVGVTTSSTGCASSSGRTTMLNAASLFVESVSLEVGVGDAFLLPCVIGDPWTTAYAIKQLRVGSIPDTQRRRKNGLTEVYTTDTLTLPS